MGNGGAFGRWRRNHQYGGNRVEVQHINDYAVFMGYLYMAVRGLRYLVLTWTTVVLLGGFVSLLEKKDFWSLTVITLVQTTGVFDVSLNEKLSNIGYSISGFLVLMGHQETCTGRHTVVGRVVTVVQVLAFTIILCPLGVVYVFGLGISTGVSLWRLIQHDYVDADSDPSKANLRAALDVLYSVALLQGAIFSYRFIFSTKGRILANAMLESYGFDADDERARRSVLDYVHETRVGCEKDPSFATRGRNLVTYALDLMESNSPDSYLSGARIMETLVRDRGRSRRRRQRPGDVPAPPAAAGSAGSSSTKPEQKVALTATQQLLESPSASHVLQRPGDVPAPPAAAGSAGSSSTTPEPEPEVALTATQQLLESPSASHVLQRPGYVPAPPAAAGSAGSSSTKPEQKVALTATQQLLESPSASHVLQRPGYVPAPPAAAGSAGSSSTTPEQKVALTATQQLLESPSASHVLQKLMRTLHTSSPYGDEARERAASIVEHLAHHIHLEQFPEGLQWIASLLQAFPSQQSQLKLILHGLRILKKLADKDSNLLVMRRRDTPGLLSKITAPVSCHHRDHDHSLWWFEASAASLDLVDRLMADGGGPGPGEKEKLRQDSQEAISSIGGILRCHDCGASLHARAIKTLENLCLCGDAASSRRMPRDGSTRRFVDVLMDCLGKENLSDIRVWASTMLEMLSSDSESIATLILDAKDDVVATLTALSLDDKDSAYMLRIKAAQMLRSLCSCSMDDECLDRLKEALIHAVPKVLQGILGIQRKRQAVLEGLYRRPWLVANDEDLEYGRVSKANDGDNFTFSPWQQSKNIELQETLLSLCATVSNTVLRADEDLTRLNKIIIGQSHTCSDTAKPVKSLPAFIREAQELLEKDKNALASVVQKFLEKDKVPVSLVGPASDLLPPTMILLEKATKETKITVA